MTAEIGTMRVTEQIDALETLAYDPIAFLIVPRLLAATIMLPVEVTIIPQYVLFFNLGWIVVALASIDFVRDPDWRFPSWLAIIGAATVVAFVIFLVLQGALTFNLGGFFDRGQADLNPFFTFIPWVFLLLVPAITMRLWAEERRSGTMELLLTLLMTFNKFGALIVVPLHGERGPSAPLAPRCVASSCRPVK